MTEPVRIAIVGPITPQTAVDVRRAMREADEQPLVLTIRSAGGDARAGLAVHHMLRDHAAPTEARIEFAASAAAVIALGARHRVIAADGWMLLHPSRGAAYGLAGEIRATADRLAAIDREVSELVGAATALPSDLVERLIHHEARLSPREAMEFGLIHEITARAYIPSPSPAGPLTLPARADGLRRLAASIAAEADRLDEQRAGVHYTAWCATWTCQQCRTELSTDPHAPCPACHTPQKETHMIEHRRFPKAAKLVGAILAREGFPAEVVEGLADSFLVAVELGTVSEADLIHALQQRAPRRAHREAGTTEPGPLAALPGWRAWR